jgi:hypothetical protein
MADEEFDLAIALSLAEAESNSSAKTTPPQYNSQEFAFFTSQPIPMRRDEGTKPRSGPSPSSQDRDRKQQDADAEFARQLEQEERRHKQQNQRESPSKGNGNPLSIFGIPLTSNGCKQCGKSLAGRYLIIDDSKYHPHCFCCFGCGRPLESRYLHRENDGKIEYYHQQCYEELFIPKCDVCSKQLVGQHRTHAFFRGEQNYCSDHDGRTRQCFSCAFKESLSDPYPELPDGRVVCWRCIDTIVIDSEEARPLYLEAVRFMETVLGLPIPKTMREVPVLAVDLSSLNEQNTLKSTTCSSVHPNCPTDPSRLGTGTAAGGLPFSGSITRGLTLTTVSEVRYISPGNLLWGDFFRHSRDHHTGGGGGSGSGTNLQFPTARLERKCSVTAVLVLCGLPRDLTTAILAHEAMHVWCKLRESMTGQPMPLLDLPPPVEEGLCQYVAHRYLDHRQEENESKARSSSGLVSAAESRPWHERLVPYFKYQIEGDPSPVYGDGFREAASCCSTIGLEFVLEHVAQNHRFPEL